MRAIDDILGIVSFMALFFFPTVGSLIITTAIICTAITNPSYVGFLSRIVILVYLIWYCVSFQYPKHVKFHSRILLRTPLMKYFVMMAMKYFSMEIIYADGAEKALIEDKRSRIHCFHTHGVYAFTMAISSAGHSFAGRSPYTVTLNISFNIPIFREILMLCGFCCSEKSALVSLLRQGKDISLSPGGVREISLWERGDMIVYIQSRKGLFEIALDEDVRIVPVLSYGEAEIYHKYTNPTLKKFQDWICSLTTAFPVIFYGRFYLPIPLRTPVTLFVGNPLPVPTSGSRAKRLKKMRDSYIDEVVRLHSLFQSKNPDNKTRLQIL